MPHGNVIRVAVSGVSFGFDLGDHRQLGDDDWNRVRLGEAELERSGWIPGVAGAVSDHIEPCRERSGPPPP